MPADRPARLPRARPPRLAALLPTLLLTLLLATVAAALAQSYRIVQSGASLGTFQVALTQGAAGTVSDSSLDLGSLARLTDHLVTDAGGDARSYHLAGTARGTQLSLDVVIHAGEARVSIDQGGRKQTLQLPLPGPVVILDNSMLDGWQIVARHLDAAAKGAQRFDVLVPQVARTGTVTFTAAGTAPVKLGGQTLDTERYDATLDVAGQKVGLQLWLDASGRIVAFAQPSAALRYELETPSGRAAASAAEAAQRRQRAALERHLAQQRRCLVEHQVTVKSTGETLAGSLTVPAGSSALAPRAPALLLLPGSGAVDRNGNAPPVIDNAMYQQLAYALACRGFAVLRIDKLGIGASSGDGNAVTLDTYARNTAAWVALLRSRPDIDPARIGLMGHSEGGLVALYAAAKGFVTPTTVVLLESPGRPMGSLIVDQLARLQRLRGASPSEVATTEAQAKQAVQAILASHGPTLALTGAVADNPVAATFAHAAGLLRSEFQQDPAVLAATLPMPVLVVQGGKDVQVPPRNGEALAKAAPHATYLYFPNLEHDLYPTSGTAIDHALPGAGTLLSSALLDALGAYLDGYLLAAR